VYFAEHAAEVLPTDASEQLDGPLRPGVPAVDRDALPVGGAVPDPLASLTVIVHLTVPSTATTPGAQATPTLLVSRAGLTALTPRPVLELPVPNTPSPP
jgi:hypothetical protein